MNRDLTHSQILKEIGVSDDMIVQYQFYLDSGNRKGQERMLRQFRRIENETLKKNREKLACMDYIIARVQNTHTLFKNNHE